MAESAQNGPGSAQSDQSGNLVDVQKSQDNTAKSQVMQQTQQLLASVTQQQNRGG